MSPAAFPMSGTLVHPVLGPVRYQINEVPDDPDQQVEQTIALMRRYAVEDSTCPQFQGDVSSCAQSDPIDDVWRYLSRKDGVRGMQFVRDETTGAPFSERVGKWSPIVETLIRPVDQAGLLQPQGDCDDFSMYGAAQLLARGVPCAYVTVAADDSDPTMYSHVYLVAYPQSGPYAGRRVPLDLSHGDHPGWETQNRFGKRREWPLVGGTKAYGCDLTLLLIAAGGYLLYRMIAGGVN